MEKPGEQTATRALAIQDALDLPGIRDCAPLYRLPLLMARLCKVRITLAVTVTTATGYMMAAGEISRAMAAPILGVFLLACGSSALNQIQERRTDALMPRTRSRPLPAGEIGLCFAICVSAAVCLAGFGLLERVGMLAAALGAFSVVWYNAVYTNLKKLTPLAIVPGALIGAVPPAIGWVAAGGSLTDPRILSFCIFLFVWQLPHFGALMMIYADEYEGAGIPTLRRLLSARQAAWLMAAWIVLAFVCGTYAALRWAEGPSIWIGLVLFGPLGAWMVVSAVRITQSLETTRSLREAFIGLNVFALAVAAVLCLGKLCARLMLP